MDLYITHEQAVVMRMATQDGSALEHSRTRAEVNAVASTLPISGGCWAVDEDGHMEWIPACECGDCGGCDEPATTTDDADNAVCSDCSDYATDEHGDTFCSRCPEYEDDGEWTGGGMHGTPTGWVSRPRVRKEGGS